MGREQTMSVTIYGVKDCHKYDGFIVAGNDVMCWYDEEGTEDSSSVDIYTFSIEDPAVIAVLGKKLTASNVYERCVMRPGVYKELCPMPKLATVKDVGELVKSFEGAVFIEPQLNARPQITITKQHEARVPLAAGTKITVNTPVMASYSNRVVEGLGRLPIRYIQPGEVLTVLQEVSTTVLQEGERYKKEWSETAIRVKVDDWTYGAVINPNNYTLV